MDNLSAHAPDLPIAEAAAGDEDAFACVMRRMTPIIRAQIQRFDFLPLGGDDLMQECMLGLLAAVRSYRPDGGALFTTYATTCIHNRLVSLARRYSNRVCDTMPYDDSEIADAADADPASRVLMQEDADRLQHQLHTQLTALEYEVLMARLTDCSYKQIAERLGVSTKAVDNAVQRLRRKLSPAH